MGRQARDRRENLPRPVQKIELNARHTKVRLALAFLFLIVGAGLIVYSLSGRPAVEAGWTQIEASPKEASCAEDFTFLYPLGTLDSPVAEQRALSSLYTEACEKAYRIFTNDVEYEDEHNVRFLNAHPNEEIEVDAALYAAFEQIAGSGDRSLYLAPVYEACDGMFYCDDSSQTAEFDPRQNEELRTWCAKTCAYASDPAQVDLELLKDNCVRLKVSEDYLAFAQAEEIGSFIDFYWTKNAFIVDYLARRLEEGGYSVGTLSSFDGFLRNLDAARDTDYSLNLYERTGNAEENGRAIRQASVLHYQGRRSIVCLRNYPLNAEAGRYYCVLPDGEIRTPYLDVRDGLCKSSLDSLVSYAQEKSCAEVLLAMIPVYIADEFQEDGLARMKEDGICSVWFRDGELCANDPEAFRRGTAR